MREVEGLRVRGVSEVCLFFSYVCSLGIRGLGWEGSRGVGDGWKYAANAPHRKKSQPTSPRRTRARGRTRSPSPLALRVRSQSQRLRF